MPARLSARGTELPCVLDSLTVSGPVVSTRKLIIAALLTGLLILVAFAVQVTMAAR